MADTSVIKSFLVSLGFTTDESALRKFSDGIDKATKAVVTLAAAVEATALAVSIGVARFASNLEALYFAAQRTGTSATNLKAFERAAQDFGATADEALGSVEALAHWMRNMPDNGEGFLRSLGVMTRDPKTGKLRDTSDLLVDLGKQFAKMPMYLSSQYAGMFGISDHMMLALRNGDFSKELEKMRREMAATNWDKVTSDAHRFMEQLRDLQTYVQAFGAQVYDALTNKLGISMHDVTMWLQKNGPMLAKRVADAMIEIVNVAEYLGGKIVWLVDKFIEWDKATNGWSTRILGLAIALRFLGGAELIGGILTLAAAFIKLGAGITTATAAGAGGWLARILATSVGGGAAAVGAGVGLGWLFSKFFPGNWLAKTGEWFAGQLYEHGDRFNTAMRELTNRGWSHEQAAGIAANLSAESGLNPNAVGDQGTSFGLAQWHDPARLAAFQAQYGHDIAHSTRGEQYDFLNFELRHGSERNAGALLRAATNAAQAGDIVSRYYERPAGGDQEAARRSADAVSLAQYTTIHVDGSRDPHTTAQAVAEAQSRVNADLVRNLNAPTQ